ncbi:Actin-related protein 5 [Lamellibrachia satsuma]|nr:Actin-related protein 5 [Lamellibrachia satsuma]
MTFDIAEYYKLYIGIERIRVPELLLQPSMVGVEQAGLTDTIDFILHKFSADEQRRLVQNVFLTGGCSSIPYLKERIECDLRTIRPFQSTFAVHVARDPVLGAWHGAKQMAQSAAFGACCINRTDYDEMGGEYIKEHFASNRYARTPILVAEAT